MYTDTSTNPPVMVSGAYATGTYTLAADKKSMTGQQAGSVMFSNATGSTTCTLSGTVSAAKVGN